MDGLPLIIMLLGATLIAAILVRRLCAAVTVPALVGYLLLGIALRAVGGDGIFGDPTVAHVFEFLGGMGVIALLFRIGIEADIAQMRGQLQRATSVWLGNVGLSGVLGYLAATQLLGYGLIPGLFVAVALTATSLGVCVGVWREAGQLNTPSGGLLTDVAELDDISGIALMIVLFAIAPALLAGDGGLAAALGGAALEVSMKVVGFAALCFLFARYLERPITGFFSTLKPEPDPMLPVLGMALLIAAIAGWLGFSLAIGALFAGLIFSRDPQAIKVDASFSSIHDLFAPFFFINIGLSFDTAGLALGFGAAGVLLLAAVAGKVIGAMVPALAITGWAGAALLGVSMVPRAEIAMVIMSEGRKLGDWAVPPELFSAMVGVVMATSVVTPVIVARMLKRWPPGLAAGGGRPG